MARVQQQGHKGRLKHLRKGDFQTLKSAAPDRDILSVLRFLHYAEQNAGAYLAVSCGAIGMLKTGVKTPVSIFKDTFRLLTKILKPGMIVFSSLNLIIVIQAGL